MRLLVGTNFVPTLASPHVVGLVVRHVAKRPSLRGQSARSSTETPFEIIGRVARHAGVLACDGPDGGLVIANVGASTIASGFAQASNVQAAMANLTLDERFSIYHPSLMSVDSFHDIGSGRFPLRPTLDQGVQRFRRQRRDSDLLGPESGARLIGAP